MINKIWFFMIAVAISFAATNGKIDLLSKEIFVSLKSSLELILGLLGSMMLWCGVLRVAEKSGLVKKLGIIISPLIEIVFHDIPLSNDRVNHVAP